MSENPLGTMGIQQIVEGIETQSRQFGVHAITFIMPDERLAKMTAQQFQHYRAAVDRVCHELPRMGLSIEMHRDVIRCCEVFRIARAE